MTPERWQQVKELLAATLEIDPAERSAYLDKSCAGDASLRAELEELLAIDHEAEPQLLNTPAVAVMFEDSPVKHARIGRRIGPYQIIEEIGVGGMGEVYRAFRADDQYRKQVAIKLVRTGQESNFVVARFKNERQVLASLDHPNIARLLDGGTTEEGVPYFVMELIEGQSIHLYCDDHKLPITERLKLFLQVCSAVQYAHQRLIIHRDLKPSNILVTREGIPKLLDFGIAKILDPAAVSEVLEPTMSMFRLLTPSYASPEQIKGEAITTASDVYSLGVLLYELLTGRHPYRRANSTPQEIARAVCEAEPERPSTAARRTKGDGGAATPSEAGASIVEHLPDSAEKLSKRLRGDLDNILLMALRKEPQRRYMSVEQFAEDIRRHLENLPVIARKDTVRYRAAKFIRRNKVTVAAAVVVAATLVLGMAVTLHEARIAQRRFNDVRQLANSLMFEVYDSIREVPGTTSARKLITQRAQEYLDRLAQESRSDAALLRELAVAYGRLADVQGNIQEANVGDTPKALENYRKAVELSQRASSLQPSNLEIRRELAQHYLGWSQALGVRAGNKSEYNHTLREAINILEPLVASRQQDSKAQATLAMAYMYMGGFLRSDNDFSGALEYQNKGLAIFEHLLKAEPDNELYQIQVASAHRAIGAVLAMQKQWEPALDQYRAALPMDEAQLARHPETFSARWNITTTYSNTGFIVARQGNLDGGLDYYRKALEIRTALAAADPEDTMSRVGLGDTYNYIAGLFDRKKDFSQAIAYFKKGLSVRRSLLQKDPTNDRFRFGVADSQSNIGKMYVKMAALNQGKPSKELALCRESIPWLEQALPAFLQRKAEGRLMGAELAGPEEIARNIETCRQTIARLSGPQGN